MLSIGKLAAGPDAGRYYTDALVEGREDYYAGELEPPGEWLGGGAALLELPDHVGEKGLLRLLEARDPGSGLPLRSPLVEGAVAGFDLAFKAPKSVSILFGISEPDVTREVVHAHEAAVREAMAYLEREACGVRRGHGGAIAMRGGGFVAAAFRHRTSRAGDPLLHTHVVVGNAVQGDDGRWSALDGRLLYRHAKTAGFLYQAALRSELTDRLQVRWNTVERGTADIAGMPRRVIEHFSQRRAEVLALMAERNEHSARSAQIATLETRRRKEYDVPIEPLRADWRARAAKHGLDRVSLDSLLGRDVAPALEQPDAASRCLSSRARWRRCCGTARRGRAGGAAADRQGGRRAVQRRPRLGLRARARTRRHPDRRRRPSAPALRPGRCRSAPAATDRA
jgi:conjugative relaxase-like TrwC/TraI family protein